MYLQQQHPKLLIWGIFVGFTIAMGSSLVVEEDENSCQMSKRIHGEMLNIKEAKRIASDTGGVVSVPKGVRVDSYENCEQECCGNINCTVYMFYPRPPERDNLNKFNCFLLNCRPQNVCALLNVSDKAPGAVVGLRDLTSPAAENPVESKTGVQLESSADNSQSLNISDGKNTSENSEAAKKQAMSKNATVSTKKHQALLNSTAAPSTVHSTKTIAGLMKGKAKINNTDHTTGASLVITLCFGILFVFAVIVLIGRPWWRSFQRPRYSKKETGSKSVVMATT